MWASIAERAERGYYIAVPSEKATPPLSTAICVEIVAPPVDKG
jgi:hypothetical protein